MKFHSKDFTIKPVRIGSRIQNGPEWGYKIIYTAPDERDKSIGETYYTKRDAQQAISKLVKTLNNVVAEHDRRS